MSQDVQVADDASAEDEVEVTADQPFKGNILIQLFDENGVIKDERRAGE